jgi:hypothetical protein
MAPKKARRADTRSAALALSARSRAAAMRDGRRSGTEGEDVMAFMELDGRESRLNEG